MKTIRYSRWDGSQEEFRLDGDRALDALSELLMEGLDVREALEWMRRHGFELAGLDMRVMGSEELMAELRSSARALEDRYRMDRALEDLRRRLDDVLDREQRALRDAHGYESARMNEFLGRRHADANRLSETIERFRDHAFEDTEAEEDFGELLEELERLRALERFLEARGSRFRGSEALDYEGAQQVRERIEALERLARDLAEGRLESLSPEELQELLSQDGVRSLLMLRDL
jgi:hypothetical protein